MFVSIPVYVICLNSQWENRGKPTIEWWSQYCSNVNRFTAIEPKDFNLEQVASCRTLAIINKKAQRIQHSDLCAPEQVACYLSHLELWKKCVKLGHPIIIVEDDARPNHLDRRLQDVQSLDPLDTTSMISIQNNPYGSRTIKRSTTGLTHNSNLLQMKQLMGMGAYYIQPSTVELLLPYTFPIDMHIDLLCSTAILALEHFNIYAVRGSSDQFFPNSTLAHVSIMNIKTARQDVLLYILATLCSILFLVIITYCIMNYVKKQQIFS